MRQATSHSTRWLPEFFAIATSLAVHFGTFLAIYPDVFREKKDLRLLIVKSYFLFVYCHVLFIVHRNLIVY